MNRISLFLVLFVAALCSFHATALAEDAGYPAVGGPVAIGEPAANDVAILIGIENYPWLPDVPGVANTLRDWEDFFDIGLRVPTIYTLAENQATREGVQRFLAQAVESAGPEGTVWFVFVGHGAPDPEEGDGLLVGVDAQASLDSLTARSLRRSEIVATLETGPQARTVVILDACFTGETSAGQALVPGAQPVLPTRVEPRVSRETVILSAAGAGEIAGPLPGLERPAFSYFLLGALRGWADDGSGEVTASQAIDFTRRKLRTVRDRRQTPESFGADLVLVRGVSEEDPLPRWRGIAPSEDPRALRGFQEPESVGSSQPKDDSSQPIDYDALLAEAELEIAQNEALIAFEEIRIFEASGSYYQGSWTNQLQGRAFYVAIERPDLADQYRPYRPGAILGATAGGLGLGIGMGLLFGLLSNSETAAMQTPTMVTSLGLGGASAGWYLGNAIFQERHPLSESERAGAAREFNQRKARELGVPAHLTVAPRVGDQVGLQMNLSW